jgi:hypothetical protein
MAKIPAGGQHVGNARHDSLPAVGGQADAQGNLVSREKTDPVKIPGQPIRVFGDIGNGLVTVLLVNPDGEQGADPMGLQKNHDIADGAVFNPGLPDGLQFFFGNSRDLGEPFDRRFENIKGIRAKMPDNLFGRFGPNALDES